jgi:CRP/FNR family transcriptional regulator, cyclic AMP receptor protein
MKSPYGLNILDNCMTCLVREQHIFCNLSPTMVQRLNDITSSAIYPRGAMLFMEGQQGRGAFVLCTGKAKLSTTSRDGRTIITKISEHGDVLGLSATISKHPYEVTAEMTEPGQANFISADSLVHFLHDCPEVALRVAQQLSQNYFSAYDEIRTLGLTRSPGEKFAKLLLGWSAERGDSNHSLHLHLALTHSEIAEMIGTTRETVSRLFADFKKKQFIQSKGTSLVIVNKFALEGMTQG